jgi:hypothetical protein
MFGGHPLEVRENLSGEPEKALLNNHPARPERSRAAIATESNALANKDL